MMRRFSGLICVVLLLVASSALADPYKDLPGVKDPATRKESDVDMVCTSQLVRQKPISPTFKRNGLAYRAYSCDYGQVKVGSSRQPNMIEYRKFKDHYQD
ncbi:MAG: hypothetical protein JWL86_6850 [Rhizobium sp.]|nr:hypothetical protein [Rhizobium sp.]